MREPNKGSMTRSPRLVPIICNILPLIKSMSVVLLNSPLSPSLTGYEIPFHIKTSPAYKHIAAACCDCTAASYRVADASGLFAVNIYTAAASGQDACMSAVRFVRMRAAMRLPCVTLPVIRPSVSKYVRTALHINPWRKA